MPLDLPQNLVVEKNKIASNSPFLILVEVVFPAAVVPDAPVLRFVNNTEDITFQGHIYKAYRLGIEFPDESSKGELTFATLRLWNTPALLLPYIHATKGGIGATVTMTIVNTAYLSEDYAELSATFDVLQTTLSTSFITVKLGYKNLMLERFPRYRYIAEHCQWGFKSPECAYSGRKVKEALVVPSLDIALDVSRETVNTEADWPKPGTGVIKDAVNNNNVIAWAGIVYEANVVTLTGVTGALPHTRHARVYPDGWGYATCDRTLNACHERGNSRRFGGYMGLAGGGARVV